MLGMTQITEDHITLAIDALLPMLGGTKMTFVRNQLTIENVQAVRNRLLILKFLSLERLSIYRYRIPN